MVRVAITTEQSLHSGKGRLSGLFHWCLLRGKLYPIRDMWFFSRPHPVSGLPEFSRGTIRGRFGKPTE
jgi:hypothetical protein